MLAYTECDVADVASVEESVDDDEVTIAARTLFLNSGEAMGSQAATSNGLGSFEMVSRATWSCATLWVDIQLLVKRTPANFLRHGWGCGNPRSTWRGGDLHGRVAGMGMGLARNAVSSFRSLG